MRGLPWRSLNMLGSSNVFAMLSFMIHRAIFGEPHVSGVSILHK